MVRKHSAPVLALRRAEVMARRAAAGLSGMEEVTSEQLEPMRDCLVELSERLARVATHPQCAPVRQMIVDLRTHLDSHLLAATSLDDLEMPERSTAVLRRGAHRASLELAVAVECLESRRSA